ncbi:MAG: hypothetical protein GY845_04505 [Planctomycetes bacterium]|nr:hypothetical protein [Planctomycetota bacterium]
MWKRMLMVVFISTLLSNSMIQAAGVDITRPGDFVRGVPNDGDWPGHEAPYMAIDDNTVTKYLHFKGDFIPNAGPTGFQVTPTITGRIITGLTFTTANDAPGRDPIAFELYGSNVSINGPYTLITRGNIVDFMQGSAWPRLTMNITPITFSNKTTYVHYQLLFTAIRGPVGGSVNSMQIAEVELLGELASTPDDGTTPTDVSASTDVTASGDTIQGVPNDGVSTDFNNNGWPSYEAPPLAIDNNILTKYLHFKGEIEPTGLRIEPSFSPSIVTGLTFTTANDATERDPISFELYGSNDSINGPYELISSGDIDDFSQATAWPRFTKNATPISFENDIAYNYYQIMFPAVRDPVRANSMQIAEVELLAITFKAFNPTPADGSLQANTWVNISWQAGDLAVSHDIYFGDNFNGVNDGVAGTFQGNQTATSINIGLPEGPYPDGLVLNTTYYWRVDEIEADGTVHKGDVWSFTVSVVEDFETGNFSKYSWSSFGDQNWDTTRSERHSGFFSAGSGSIEDFESTTLQVSIDCVSGDITFYCKVSSESHHDNLKFKIDGVEKGFWSGEEDWFQVSIPVDEGTRTFEWTYSKDGSDTEGDDAVWIDDVVFPIGL